MQANESIQRQSYLPIVPVGNEPPKTTSFAITLNRKHQAALPISTGEIEGFLITAGTYYAMQLAKVLDALSNIKRDAIYPITAILEPYIGTTELAHMPVIANREVGETEDNDGQGESFFRFLDELESGAYAADDTVTEE